MENLPVLANINLPAYLRGSGKGADLVAAAMVGAPINVPRISLKQGRFRINDGADEFVVEQLYLDATVVGVVPGVSKIFYSKPWNPNDEPTEPDCQSLLGDKPTSGSPSPQNVICATCPKNQWGSKITPQGTEIKACSDSRRLAVVATDDPEKTYLLVVPAASMKNFTKYVKTLSMHGLTPDMARTRLTFDTQASYPLLQFAFAGVVEEDAYAMIGAKLGSVEVNDVLGIFASGKAPALAAPTPAPVAPTQQNVIPMVQPQAPAPEPEAPKRGFGKGRPVGSKNKPKDAPAAPAAQPAVATRGFGGTKVAASAPPVVQTQPSAPVQTTPVAVNGNAMSDLESELDALIGK
jgi:hypothetical protein